MKKYIIILFLSATSFKVSSQQVFDRYFTFGSWSWGSSILEYPGHGYFVAGNIDSFIFDSLNQLTGQTLNAIALNFNYNGDTIKTFQIGNGDTLYHHLFGGNSDDYFRTAVITDDGNILIVGESASYNPQNRYDADLWLLKINTNLDTLWLKTFSILDSAIFMNYATATKTNSDGLAVPGSQTLFSNSNLQSQLTVFDSTGNLKFHQRLLPLLLSQLEGAVQTSDLGFLATGFLVNNLPSNDWSPLIIKTDSLGNTQWYQTLPYSGDEHGAENIIKTQDGYYVYVWQNVYYPTGAHNKMWHYHATKINEQGVEQWTKDYAYSFSGHQRIAELPNGNLMISGWYTDTTGDGLQGYLMLCNPSGDSLWWRFIGSTVVHRFMDGKPTSDGGFIMTGDNYCCNFVPQLGYQTGSLWIVKVDSLGLLTSINNFPKPELNLASLGNPYPNPSSGSCTVTSIIPPINETGPGEKGSCLLLFDLRGKQLQKIKLNPGLNQTIVDLSAYSVGEYVLALSFDGYNAGTKKIIKQ